VAKPPNSNTVQMIRVFMAVLPGWMGSPYWATLKCEKSQIGTQDLIVLAGARCIDMRRNSASDVTLPQRMHDHITPQEYPF